MVIRVVPVGIADANRYVEALHRHNGRLPSAKFCCAAIDETGSVLGVAIAGIPKARMLTDGGTLEVNRVCTDGSRNVCSKLYGACIRAARALGYWRAVTYTLESEAGASLRAAGWQLEDAAAGGGSWQEDRGTGTLLADTGPKNRWRIILSAKPPSLTWPESVQAGQESLFDQAAV